MKSNEKYLNKLKCHQLLTMLYSSVHMVMKNHIIKNSANHIKCFTYLFADKICFTCFI